jgi:hypothetical protein
MATVNKNFKVKNGLIVEGATATVNNFDVLTKKQDDQDYIVNLIGGTATSANEANKVVKRDENGDFSAHDITVSEISIGSIGRIYDDGDLIIENIDGQDVTINAEDIRLNATDDIRLTSGTGSDIVLSADSGNIRFEAPNIYAGENLQYVDSEKVATRGRVDSQIGDATVDGTSGNTVTDRIATALSTATQDLSDHEALTAGVHGVLGTVVGTTDSQDLSNKRIIDTLYFTDGVTVANEAQIVVIPESHDFEIQANSGYGDLNLRSVSGSVNIDSDQSVSIGSNQNVTIDSSGGDIILSAGGSVYKGSSSVSNEIVTQERLDSYLGDNTINGTGGNTVTDRIATAVANLVDGAPELLDTLNELAAAIGDDDSFASTVATDIGTKVSRAGDTMTGALNLYSDPTSNLEAATKQYVDTAETDANTYADNAVSDHSDLTTGVHGVTGDVVGTSNAQTLSNKTIDGPLVLGEGSTSSIYGLTGNIYVLADNHVQIGSVGDVVLSPTGGAYVGIQDPANKIATEGYVNDQDTDDVAEGTSNLYFTDARAKSSATDLLVNAATTNISITEGPGGLIIEAENGVADSDTDDLVEGETNLYFTDERAVDALEAVVPNFTEVNINTVARQVAARVEVPTASQVTAFEFSLISSRSAKFLVKSQTATHTELSEILITRDLSGNIAITEYGNIGTNGPLMTITADSDTPVPGIDVTRLRVTTLNNDTVVTVVGTLLA